MKRILSLMATLFAVLVLTTGCYKVNADFTVNADDTVTGTLTVGYPKNSEAQRIPGTKAEFARDFLGNATFKTQLHEFADETFYGVKADFENVPFADFNLDSTDTNKYGFITFSRIGDNIVFEGVIDPTRGEKSIAELAADLKITEAQAEAFTSTTNLRVTLDIPGTIKQTNGTLSDGGITWVGKFGKPLQLHAETWAPKAKNTDLLPVAGLLIIGIFVLAFMLGRPKNKKLKNYSYE